MLHLLLQIAGTRYALEATGVIEVLPIVHVEPLAPPIPGLAGLINYRGIPIPVVDLGLHFTNIPTPRRIGTRIIAVETPASVNVSRPPVALLVERILGAAPLAPESFRQAGPEGARRVAHDPTGFIHLLDLAGCLQPVANTSDAIRSTAPCAATPSKSF